MREFTTSVSILLEDGERQIPTSPNRKPNDIVVPLFVGEEKLSRVGLWRYLDILEAALDKNRTSQQTKDEAVYGLFTGRVDRYREKAERAVASLVKPAEQKAYYAQTIAHIILGADAKKRGKWLDSPQLDAQVLERFTYLLVASEEDFETYHLNALRSVRRNRNFWLDELAKVRAHPSVLNLVEAIEQAHVV